MPFSEGHCVRPDVYEDGEDKVTLPGVYRVWLGDKMYPQESTLSQDGDSQVQLRKFLVQKESDTKERVNIN